MQIRLVNYLTMILIVTVVGCSGAGNGPPLGEVAGTVTFDGKPASNITVTFNPADGGRSSFGTTDEQGKYTLVYSTTKTGAQLGKHNVTIGRDETPSDSDVNLMKPKNPIPGEYAKATKEVEVEAGRNAIDLAYP